MKNLQQKWNVKYVIPVVLILIVALRIISYGVFVLDTFYECFLCAIYGIWGVSVWYRITDELCKRLFLELSAMMMFWEVLRTIKYHHLTNPIAVRMAWYGFYIPMIMMAVLSFLLAQSLLCEDAKKRIKKYRYLNVIAVSFIALVLTNEYHHAVFVFPKDSMSSNPDYTYGVGYVAVIGFIALMVGAMLVTLIRKCSLSESRKYVYIPLLLIGLSVIILILYVLGIQPVIGGINLFTLPDMICLIQIIIWESCIFIGLIPANDGYYDIFLESSLGAKILDLNGNVVVQNHCDNLTESEHTVASNEPILGGTLYYLKDLSRIHRQQDELLEAKETIAGENLLIEEENKLLEDDARYRMLNRVYDEIADCVHMRTVKIEELLEDDCATNVEFSKRLAKACFINAYIKRRSNLILQSKQDTEQYIMELYLGLVESVNYLSLTGVKGFVCPYKGDDSVPIEMLFKAYDFFQDVVETVMDQMSAVMVDISGDANEIGMRLVMDIADASALAEIVSSYDEGEQIHTEIVADDDGTIVIMRLMKGGAI